MRSKKKFSNNYSAWSEKEENLLINLHQKGIDKKDIAGKLGRSTNAVHLRLKILVKDY